MVYFSESELAQWLERLSSDLVFMGSNITSYLFIFFYIFYNTINYLTEKKEMKIY